MNTYKFKKPARRGGRSGLPAFGFAKYKFNYLKKDVDDDENFFFASFFVTNQSKPETYFVLLSDWFSDFKKCFAQGTLTPGNSGAKPAEHENNKNQPSVLFALISLPALRKIKRWF